MVMMKRLQSLLQRWRPREVKHVRGRMCEDDKGDEDGGDGERRRGKERREEGRGRKDERDVLFLASFSLFLLFHLKARIAVLSLLSVCV